MFITLHACQEDFYGYKLDRLETVYIDAASIIKIGTTKISGEPHARVVQGSGIVCVCKETPEEVLRLIAKSRCVCMDKVLYSGK